MILPNCLNGSTPRRMQLAILLQLCIALSSATVVGAAGDGLVVQTQQGNIAGTLVSPTVRQFLGIPFAAAGRWEAPRPPPIRNTTFNATKFGASCIQTLSPMNVEFLKLTGVGNDSLIVPEAEDCLSVNIWAPSSSRKQKTAVMIWIYGGGFQMGTVRIITLHTRNALLIFHRRVILCSMTAKTWFKRTKTSFLFLSITD